MLAVLSILLYSMSPATRSAILTALLAQRFLLVLLLGFCLLTLSLLWSAGERMDARIFLYFNQHYLRSIYLDWFMVGVTQIGNGVVGLALSAVLYFWGDRRLGIELALGILTLWICVELIKSITARARPYFSLEQTQIVGWRERGRSFPSGHTAQTFFLATILVHFFQLGPIATLILFGGAALVGFTRIYVGVHYPRDVLAGAILGSVWGLLIILIDPFLAGRLV
jgi:membrane-associated phospholipid phosphatase